MTWITRTFQSRHTVIACGLVALAVVIGGGGSPSPAAELWLELLAAAAALAWLWQKGPLRFPTDRRLWLIAVIVMLVPAVQLVPLPPAIWHNLPGREQEVAALRIVGSAFTWQPLSMSPPRTLASLLATIPPVIVLLMTGALTRSERRRLIAVVAFLALVSAFLGAMQLGSGEAGLRIYEKSPTSYVIGFQANRNSTADVLLIGLAALAAHWAGGGSGSTATGSRRGAWWLAGGALVLALACIFTGSRAGILLLVPVAIAAWSIVIGNRPVGWRRMLPVIALAGFAAIAGAQLLLRQNAALQKIAARFELASGREELWADTLYAIGQYWPFGSGMGTFVPSFIAFEPLEAVDPSVPNRAHNDYLELALEAGAFGLVALAAIAALLVLMALRGWRAQASDRAQVGFALTALAIVAAHSVVDYPLRSISLACLAALSAGLLSAAPRNPGET